MNLFVKVDELASGVLQEELALNEHNQRNGVHHKQTAIESNGWQVVVEDQIAPGNEESQLPHKKEEQRKNDSCSSEQCVGNHNVPSLECLVFAVISNGQSQRIH